MHTHKMCAGVHVRAPQNPGESLSLPEPTWCSNSACALGAASFTIPGCCTRGLYFAGCSLEKSSCQNMGDEDRKESNHLQTSGATSCCGPKRKQRSEFIM